MLDYLVGIPAFLGYFAIGMVAFAVFTGIYTSLTPHKEVELIRAGNVAAVTAFLGALIGFSLPLASAAANSVSVVDYIIWAVIGILAQIMAFYIANFTMQRLHEKITNGDMAAGLWGGGIALAVGILNAACMTY
ncbi:MAG: putative transrane protein [Devosia sp.]|nr:putative transrane protein [Devosia sp.]